MSTQLRCAARADNGERAVVCQPRPTFCEDLLTAADSHKGRSVRIESAR
jgi:hypothetical protein